MTVADGTFRPLMQWLGRLDGVRTVLHMAVQRIRQRQAVEAAPAGEDVDRARALLGRTIRWWGALLMRMCTDLEAEKAALREEFEPDTAASALPTAEGAEPGAPRAVRAVPCAPDAGAPAASQSTAQIMERACANLGAAMAMLGGAGPAPAKFRARPVSHGRVRAKPRRPRTPDPDSAIRRKPVAEILDQICADLGAAATLLGETDAAREVAAIRAAARALLTGAGAGTMAASMSMPVPGARTAGGAGPLPLSAAAAPHAPDTG
jgi:hypothetical protein